MGCRCRLRSSGAHIIFRFAYRLLVCRQRRNASRRIAITKQVKAQAQISPRLLNKQQAAAYCGIGTSSFDAICPVPALALGAGVRLYRYDVRSLDKWIDGLSATGSLDSRDWMSEMDKADGNGSANQRH